LSLVEVERVSLNWGRRRILDEISFDAEAGASLALLGPNGSGKSALLRVLATAVRPSAGHIRIDGLDTMRDAQAVRRRIGYVPDQFGIYRSLTVLQYLDFFARAAGVAAWERRSAVESMLRVVDLYDLRNNAASELSRGLTRRLALARALIHNPAILLLDDPLSGLDGRGRLELREVLRELHEMGVTLVVASHLLSDLVELCSEVLVMNDGRLVHHGPLSGVLDTASRPERRVRLEVLEGHEIAVSLLDDLPQVGEVLSTERTLTFSLFGDEAILADVLAQLMAAGVRVARYGPGVEEYDELSAGLAEISMGRTA